MNVYDFQVYADSCFAEDVTYTPSGGVGVIIKAVVFRNAPAKVVAPKSDVPVQAYKYVVMINRTDITQVVVGQDKIQMPDVDGTTKVFRVQAIIASDPGCFKLGVN
jgi:hypothetical protein